MINKIFETKKTLNLGGSLLDLSTPIIMGILNTTPDSFYDGGLYTTEADVVGKAAQMIEEGASIIDIGGASSRPNAKLVPENEEYDRVIPLVKLLIKEFPGIKLSIDTFRSSIAEAGINEGAVMINDISGGEMDEKMFETVAKYRVVYVLMHMQGNPENMISMNQYNNLISEITDYFQRKIYELTSIGIHDVVIDAGFGFAKNINQNFELLKNLSYFKSLNVPLLAGISRKSMIYKKLGILPEEALNGTSVLNTIALIKGANILRVHDVKEALQAIKLFKATFN